ncbi:MAG: TonB-dependent receptor [Saprospiraceae bacterium]|nr:TonB-dependent receptor [Saprospiraceae bacterium]
MKATLLPVFLCLGMSWAGAQAISGRILKADGASAEFATVMLMNAADSALVKGDICDADGRFILEKIPPGRYFLQSELIGEGRRHSPVFEHDAADKTLADLQLSGSDQELSEVTVTARKPIVEVQADKTVLNVEGNVNSTGQNALELLRKAPGVMLDNNDNISLKGKNTVRIQIDGRDVPMDNRDLAVYLKSMRAEDIAAIELITNPSAKYDASGNAGIINIRTKKNKNIGTNGSVGGEFIAGETPKGGGNVSLNHRNKRFNAFGNYSNHFGIWHNWMDLYREQDGLFYDQHNQSEDHNNNHNFKVGTDFFINDRHTVGFIVDGRHNEGPNRNQAKTYIGALSNPGVVDSILIAASDQEQVRSNGNFNINYRYADTSGHELNIDANRGFYRFRGDAYQPNAYVDPNEQTVLSRNDYRFITPTDVDMTIAKADYEQRFLTGKLGIGYKFTHVVTDNTFEFYDIVNGAEIINPDRSNRFEYDELVNAGYVNYNTKIKKWGFQAGLRAEYTNWEGVLTSLEAENNETNDDQYLSLFPSGAVTYELNAKNQFSLTYSRRIDRPNYQSLNPFENRLDELTYRKGNPFLKPQFTNSVELTHTFMGFMNTTLGYSRTTDLFTEIIDTLSGGRTFLTEDNIGRQDVLSLSMSIPMPIAKWWEGFLSITGFIQDYEATFREGFSVDERFSAANLYTEQTIKLPKGWSFQVSGWFNTPSIWQAVFRSEAMGAMDLGVKKELFDGMGTASISFGDVLGTAGWKSVNDFTPGLYMTGQGRWESRTIRMNFNYRFGNKEVKGARQRKTGLEDVNKRLGK